MQSISSDDELGRKTAAGPKVAFSSYLVPLPDSVISGAVSTQLGNDGVYRP